MTAQRRIDQKFSTDTFLIEVVENLHGGGRVLPRTRRQHAANQAPLLTSSAARTRIGPRYALADVRLLRQARDDRSTPAASNHHADELRNASDVVERHDWHDDVGADRAQLFVNEW